MGNVGIIDCWINLNSGRTGGAVSYLFRESAEDMATGADPAQIADLMAEVGIEKGLLAIDADDPAPALAAMEAHPDVFYGAMRVDPHLGMAEVRRIESMARDYPIKAVKVSAHAIQKPYNDKIYYPIYAKCIELGLPITANVGIPGPRVPGAAQHPISLDEVCWFFPDLKVVMTHIGEPWQQLCIKLMIKWENLFYMTSAFAPRYYPPEVIHYANTRGQSKVMFASDYPLLSFERCVRELADLPLRENVRPLFLRDNAARIFDLK